MKPESKRVLLVATLAFIAGASLPKHPRTETHPAPAKPAADAQALPRALPQPLARDHAPPAALASKPQTTSGASTGPEVSSSALDPQAFEDPEAEALPEGYRAPILSAGETHVQENDDGSRDEMGKTVDGKDFYKHFNPRQELAREGWTAPSGETLNRTYYERGGLREVYWAHDENVVAINLTQSGLIENRYVRRPDGTATATTYDDRGRPKSSFDIEASGSAKPAEDEVD